MQNRLEFESLQFQFEVIDLGELDAEELLSSLNISDVILAILCRKPDSAARLKRIISRIQSLEPEQRKRAARQLLLLSIKRNLAESVLQEVAHMGITFEIEDDQLLGRLYEKGRTEGRTEAETHVLRLQLRQKFGPLPQSVEAQINSASHEQLEIWITRVLAATRIEEVLD